MSKNSTNMDGGFLISYDWLPALESLSAEDFQSLLLALIKRQKDGEPLPTFENPTVGIYAKMIEPTIKRRLYGQVGGSISKGTTQGTTQASKVKKSKVNINVISNDITIGAKTRKCFIKPTVEEVREYCQERGNTVDPETFVNFYESKGWVVGKSPMKDWKAAVRNWERSRAETTPPQETFSSFETDDFFIAALADSERKKKNALNSIEKI